MPIATGGLSFDGTTGFVQIASTLPQITTSFTVELWMRSNNLNANQTYILGRANVYSILYGYVSGNVEFCSGLGYYTGSDPRPGTAMPISDNNWHHIAYSYDGAIWSGYLDGVQQFSVARTFALLSAGASNLVLGAANTLPQNNAPIALKNVTLWNVARTQTEIQSDMKTPLQGTELGLVGYWPLIEGVGTTAFDLTANGNNGTLQGGCRWANLRTARRYPSLSFPGQVGNCVAGKYVQAPEFTIECVVTPTGLQGASGTNNYFCPFSTRPNDGSMGGFNLYCTNTGVWGAYLAHSSSNGDWSVLVGPKAQSKIAGRLCATYDGTTYSFYVNGALVSSGPTAFYQGTGTQFNIGQINGGSFPWTGTIQDVRIYNRALSALEVVNNFLGNVTRSGLVGEWLLNDGYGTVAHDTSGYNNHGTISGALWLGGGAQPTGGLLFPGTGYEYVSTTQTFQSLITTNKLTVEAWAYVSNTNYPFNVIAWTGNSEAQGFKLMIDYRDESSNIAAIWWEIGDNTTQYAVDTFGSWLQPGYWHHIVGTFDGNQLISYIDGVQTGTLSATTTIYFDVQPLQLGRWSYNPQWPLQGSLGLFRVYNRCLSLAEVYNNYSGGSVNRNGIVLEYLCNENSGTVLHDTSGNGSNGTIVGATW